MLTERNAKIVLNEANPGKLPAAAQIIRFGDLVAGTLRVYRAQCVSNVLVLPSNAKAAHLVRARVNSGADVGVKAIALAESAPGANEAAIGPDGNIIFNSAAGDPLVEVMYHAHGGDERTATVSVVADNGAIPYGLSGLTLVSVTATVGGVIGSKTIVARGTAAPAAGEAALNDAGDMVVFNAADAVTMADLVFVALPGEGSEPVSPASKTLETMAL